MIHLSLNESILEVGQTGDGHHLPVGVDALKLLAFIAEHALPCSVDVPANGVEERVLLRGAHECAVVAGVLHGDDPVAVAVRRSPQVVQRVNGRLQRGYRQVGVEAGGVEIDENEGGHNPHGKQQADGNSGGAFYAGDG